MATGIIQLPTQLAGTPGVYPNFKYMVTADNLATITTAGYLNAINLEGSPITTNDIIQVLYSYDPVTETGTYLPLAVSISNGVITLIPTSNAGEVVLPTIANHIATYVNTAGKLSEDPATAISGGNISAGYEGVAGGFLSYSGTLNKGYLYLKHVANASSYATQISNASMGQTSTFTIPDPATATANFAVAPAALVNNNLIKASGTAGLVADSGIAASSVPTFTSPTIANHIAVFTNTTGNLGEDAATAINAGNIQAGLSGTAGTVASFPATGTNGSLIVAATNAGGAFNTTISNGTMAQSTVYTIPDVTAATGQFLVKTAALVNGNLVQASGTAGVTVDSGIVATAVMQKTAVNTMTGAGQIILAKANGTEAANAVTASGNAGVITTSALTTAGGGTYAITWTNTLITSTSVFSFCIQGGTNTVQNITFTCVPGAGTATLTIYNNTAATQLNGTILIGYTVL